MNLSDITAYVTEATSAVTGLEPTEYGLRILMDIRSLSAEDHTHVEHEQTLVVEQREQLQLVIRLARDLLESMQVLLDNGYPALPVELVNTAFLRAMNRELQALYAARQLFRPEMGAVAVTSSVGPERPSPPR